MTDIWAKVICDHVSAQGIRITTMHLRYPRFIHAELMTHRVFSRNARSSRAVPVDKMIKEVVDNPVIPIHWGAAQKGMQAYEECQELVSLPDANRYSIWPYTSEQAWIEARDQSLSVARAFNSAGYHKQIINRLLEPFMHIDTLITATEWTNFFALRDHVAAEPHMQVLARAMKRAMSENIPTYLPAGVWHHPYANYSDYPNAIDYLRNQRQIMPTHERVEDVMLKLSVARCARISYEPFDGDGSIAKEMARYELLVGSHPMHASPAEHQATPDRYIDPLAIAPEWKNPSFHGNFRGYIQYRKTIPGECVRETA